MEFDAVRREFDFESLRMRRNAQPFLLCNTLQEAEFDTRPQYQALRSDCWNCEATPTLSKLSNVQRALSNSTSIFS